MTKMWCVVFPVPKADKDIAARFQGVLLEGIGSILKEVDITEEEIVSIANRITDGYKHGVIKIVESNQVVKE